jgi:predicted ester cyclase
MSETDKATLRRIQLEVLNQGRLEVLDEAIAPRFTEHMEMPGHTSSREGFKAFLRDYTAAFPDVKYTVLREISEGDLVVQYVSATGTTKGDFGGMRPTGKSATWTEMQISRMEHGKAVEHWAVVDMLGMFTQLGLIPAPPEMVARAA